MLGFEVAKLDLPLWWLLALAVIGTALLGGWRLLRSDAAGDRSRGAGFVALAVLAFLFALGDQGATGPLFAWAYEHIPGFNGFREPQKAVGLLVIAYAVLGAAGLEWLRGRASPRLWAPTMLLTIGAVWVVLIVGHGQVTGRDRELRPASFPDSWQAANELLSRDSDDFQVLVLPWHQYLGLQFLEGRVVSNPARVFFEVPLIVGDNIELPSLYSDSNSRRSSYIEAILAARGEVTQLGNLLVPLGVKYVALLKEADYGDYGFLSRQAALELVSESPELALYRNSRFAGRIYAVDRTAPEVAAGTLIADLGARADLGSVAPIRDAEGRSDGATVAAVEITGAGAKVTVEAPGWLVFTDTFDHRLTLDGVSTSLAYGSVNAFRVERPGELTIEPRGMARTWTLRAISVATVAGLLMLVAGPAAIGRVRASAGR